MDHIVLQLEDIRKPEKIETDEAKVTNFSVLSTNLKRKVGFKRKMSCQLVDEFRTIGLQSYNLDEKLNLTEIMKEGKEKDIIKNKPHMVKAVAVPNLNINYRRKKK